MSVAEKVLTLLSTSDLSLVDETGCETSSRSGAVPTSHHLRGVTEF